MLGSGLALALCATRARADAPRSPRVDYVAPTQCPDEASFQRSLALRMQSRPPLPIPLRLRIEARGDRYVGQLGFVDTEGAASTREVTAQSCEELVDAMAFLAAVTLTLGASATPDAVVPPPAVKQAAAPAAPAALQSHRRWRFAAGAEAEILSWVGTTARVAPEPFVEARREGPGLVVPTIRLSATRVTSSPVTASGEAGQASLTLTAARLEGCPISWRPLTTVALLPCLGVRGGVLEGVGAGVAIDRTQDRAWLSAELLGRVEWAPFTWLFFELQGGGSVPFLRYQFFFSPDSNLTLTETPVLGWFVGAGGGVRLPW
jgi:hypothetical protein